MTLSSRLGGVCLCDKGYQGGKLEYSAGGPEGQDSSFWQEEPLTPVKLLHLHLLTLNCSQGAGSYPGPILLLRGV